MTLDAGGTNFVFSAVQSNRRIVEPLSLPSHGNDLEKSLQTIRQGFAEVRRRLSSPPSAISFSFPGPADYAQGVIGDLLNLPAYRGGVPLGPMLEHEFGLPVFINNDGDLFAYGEAIAGLLPTVNRELAEAGSGKRYENLLGITLGTGFGAGIVRRGELFLGDNGAAAEIWTFPNKFHPETPAEEAVSIRGMRRFFAERCGCSFEESPSPKEIYEIAAGVRPGNLVAAREAFALFGEAVGHALVYASSLIDGLIVIGGGIAGAAPFFLPALVREMNRPLKLPGGGTVPRTESRVFNLENKTERAAFIQRTLRRLRIPGTEREVSYDPEKQVGVGLSLLGTETAVAVGAYAFALHELDAVAAPSKS